jgi:hypothetical protein
MAAFYRLIAHLSPAQLHALVAWLEALARHAPGHVGRAVYCGPHNLHDARQYVGPCA